MARVVAAAVHRAHERLHASYESDGWICGRVTMEPFDSFAFAVDGSGRLAWESNDVGGDHVVAVVSHRVSDDDVALLRERGVSYVLAGTRDVDLPLAVEKIAARFGVRTLMLEGGGHINGAMLRAGLVDEVSVLLAPVADGRSGTPALFEASHSEPAPRRLTLNTV